MRRRILSGLALVALAIGLVVSTPIASSANENHIKKAATGQERAPVIRSGATVKTAPSLSAGVPQAAEEARRPPAAPSGGGAPAGRPGRPGRRRGDNPQQQGGRQGRAPPRPAGGGG